MALYEDYRGEGRGYAIWKMEESLDQLAALLHNPALLAAAQSRFTHPVKQMEFLAVRLLIAHSLAPHEEVEYLPTGKPFLKSHSHFISISHTRGYVALAWNETCESGVDIEQRAPRVTKVRSRFVNDDEEAALDRSCELEALLLHWSAKETAYKILDVPGLDFKVQLHIHPFKVQPSGQFFLQESRTPVKRLFVIDYLVKPDFVFTCSFASGL